MVSNSKDLDGIVEVHHIGQRDVKAVFLNPGYDPMVDANFNSTDTLPFSSIA